MCISSSFLHYLFICSSPESILLLYIHIGINDTVPLQYYHYTTEGNGVLLLLFDMFLIQNPDGFSFSVNNKLYNYTYSVYSDLDIFSNYMLKVA